MELTRSRGVRAIVIAAGSVFIAAAVVAALSYLLGDSRERLTIADVLASASSTNGYAAEALGGATSDTALCVGVQGCVEGASSSGVEVLRFESQESAEEFARGSADVYQSDWIVIRYLGEAPTAAGRAEIEQLLDGLWTSE